MKWARSVPWYYWLGALAIPGGLVVLAWRARRAPGVTQAQAESDAGTTNARKLIAAEASTRSLISAAQIQSDLIRRNLSGDALAAQLLGLPFDFNLSQNKLIPYVPPPPPTQYRPLGAI